MLWPVHFLVPPAERVSAFGSRLHIPAPHHTRGHTELGEKCNLEAQTSATTLAHHPTNSMHHVVHLRRPCKRGERLAEAC